MAIREIEIPGYPNAGHTFPEHQLAHDLLDNRHGVILGESAHNHFNLPYAKNIAPADEEGFYIKSQIDMNGKFCRIDLYGEANALPLDDNSQGFVASSHCLEHVPDLIGAFVEAARVLTDGGILHMIVPKRYARAEDADRPISTIVDFARAYNEKWTSETIPADVAEAAGGKRGHIWVFTLESLKEVLLWSTGTGDIGWDIIAEEETDTKAGNGHTLVAQLRKPEHLPLEGSLGDVLMKTQDALAGYTYNQGMPRGYT